MRLIDADALGNRMYHESFEKDSDLQRWDGGCWIRYKLFEKVLRAAPTIDPTLPTPSNTLGALDCVERQKAIDELIAFKEAHKADRFTGDFLHWTGIKAMIENLPSVQPERTCVNCGRTVNNGGWYADGRTRCPIEEHYALPKDGYCHLWEKRNVTDDDYPERREDERPES